MGSKPWASRNGAALSSFGQLVACCGPAESSRARRCCSLEQRGRDPLASVLRVDADVADDVGRLRPHLGEADHLTVLGEPGVQRRIGSRPGEPLPDLVLRGAAHALVGERAAAHELGEPCDVVERRSSNLHGEAPFGKRCTPYGLGPRKRLSELWVMATSSGRTAPQA